MYDTKTELYKLIEQKGMTFDRDKKKEGTRKGERISKNRDQSSCLSARSFQLLC